MRTLDDVVDGIGLGFGQLIIVLVGGEIYSGLIKTLVTTCSVSFAHDLGFKAYERGWLVSMLFVGNFAGNFASGALSDFCGRRLTILVGYLVGIVSLLGSLLSSNLAGAMAYRTGFGLAAGIMGPTSWTLLGEIAPSKKRLQMHSVGHIAWFMGAMFMLTLVHFEDPTMQKVPWKSYTVYTLGITILCLVLSIYYVLESPSHLSLQGRRQDAILVLETLRRRNGVQVDVQNWETRESEKLTSEESQSWSYLGLFDRTSAYTSVTLACCTFTFNFSGYGLMYALPIILGKSALEIVPSTTMMISMACGLLGILVGVPISGTSRSRPRFLGYVLIARAVFVFGFLAGVWHGEGGAMIVAITCIGVFGKSLMDAIACLIVYLYAIEVRPTQGRASSSGFALGIGRLGGVVAPITFEAMNSPVAFAASVWILGIFCAVLVLLLPLETKDRQLGEIVDEIAPLSSRASSKCQTA